MDFCGFWLAFLVAILVFPPSSWPLPSVFGFVVSGAFALFLASASFLGPFIMSRSFVRTVVLDVSAFAAEIKVDEIASKICAYFEEGDVVSVQFMPARAVRVTFSSEALKRVVLNSPSLTVDGIDCPVRGGGPRSENVLIYRYPYEADVNDLKTKLSQFGVVHDVKYRAWSHLNGVMDGCRVVRMTRSCDIPRTILINGLQCKAWYRGMPVTCDICEGSHKAQDCPFKGVCMHCRQPGHVRLFCPNPPNAWGTAVDNPTPAEANAVNPPPAVVPAMPIAADAPAVPVAADAPATPVAADPPVTFVAAAAPPVSLADPDSSDAIIEVIASGGGSEPMDSQSQSILPCRPSPEDVIESFSSTVPEQGSGSMLWSDSCSDLVNAVDSQINDVFGASDSMDTDYSDVNNTTVSGKANFETHKDTDNVANKNSGNKARSSSGVTDLNTSNGTNKNVNKVTNKSSNETNKNIQKGENKSTNDDASSNGVNNSTHKETNKSTHKVTNKSVGIKENVRGDSDLDSSNAILDKSGNAAKRAPDSGASSSFTVSKHSGGPSKVKSKSDSRKKPYPPPQGNRHVSGVDGALAALGKPREQWR